jgi:Bacterial Ig-like domain (group 3)
MGEDMKVLRRMGIVAGSVCIATAIFFTFGLLLTSNSAYASPVFIPAPNRADMVHDRKRNMLYITNGDQVLRYDMSSNSFASPWVLGGNLKGIDISPDDNTLVVADLSATETEVWVYLVNISDGTNQKLIMDRNYMEAGTYAVAFGGDGKIYSTSDTAGSGWQPFRQIDPQTKTAVNLLTISDQTMVTASSNGEIVGFAEGNISDGRFGSYNIITSELKHQTGYDLGTGWYNYEIAVNHDGTQFAIPTYGGTFIYDQDLNKIKALGTYAVEYADGAAYNPVTNDLYLSLVDTTFVRAYDSNTFEPLADYDFGQIFGTNYNWSLYEGRLKTSKDGNILFALVNGGVEYLVLDIVLRNPTTTAIASSLNPSVHTQMVTFTATVTSGNGMPTGNVTFMDGATKLGKSTLSGDPATATLSLSSLSVGAHSIKAVYGGDTDLASSVSPVLAQTVLKGDSPVLRVPSEYPTIQEAINTAATDDTVLVEPGTYFENINFSGKAIHVMSEQGPDVTILDGNLSDAVAKFISGEGPNSVLSGFRLQNGYASWGAGITIQFSSPTIYGNIFDGNDQSAGGFGAAIGGNGSSAIIEQNYFLNNTCDTQWLSGVVSFINSSSPTIANNIFYANSCTAINMTLPQGNHPSIINNTIVGNRLGIRVDRRVDSSLQDYRNNIIVENGSGLHVDFGSETYNPIWRNNIVFNNNGVDYDGIGDQTGINGNLSADPLFVNAAAYDYHLLPCSPAINTGDNSAPNLPETDFDGNQRIINGRVDIGVFEYAQAGPALTLDPITSPTRFKTQTLTGTMEANAAVTVICTSATVGEVYYPTSTTWAVTLSHMVEGPNSIAITASDNACNSRVLDATIFVDTTWTSIPGLTASPPALAWNPSANELQMVVRAADDTIWAATFDPNGVFNNDWINIPGLMADTPALAWNTLTSKLHLVARASDSTLWAATFNSGGTFNNDWTPIPGLADSPPALVWNPVSSEFLLVVRASDSTLWAATFNSNGVFNNDWVNVPGRTASPPSLTWNPAANEIQMVVRASDDTMWGSTFDSSCVFNNDWVNIPGRTVSPSAIVWDGFGSGIAMMVRAFDNTMWYSTFSSAGVFNNDWINFPGMTVSTPAMAYLPSIGYLDIVVRAFDNSLWTALY